MTGIEYFDLYQEMRTHQRDHHNSLWSLLGDQQNPQEHCTECLLEKAHTSNPADIPERASLRKHYSWAIPNEEALDVIAKHSPHGVVEIGAGGGYWATLLQQRGVDVVAYDPAPENSKWHHGTWTVVHSGDHRVAADHPTRTLLLCWPSYREPWAAKALEYYAGDTVIYIGEGCGGCTGDNRFHALLGNSPHCSHYDDDYNTLPCPHDCLSKLPPRFEQVENVDIPQWFGLHDGLRVYRRLTLTEGQRTRQSTVG
ncbi:MAG: methyltransferase domain-containing protein [Candidatus Dormibacteria bacterium]